MKKLFQCLLVGAGLLAAACSNYKYESAKGDPLKARIYTLGNGLKVYMTVYKDAPRIRAYVAVRVGGKNDPAETTGLAHYFEHLMFKGTSSFGTMDYAQEKPLLDSIERLFEVYRTKTDDAERKALYAQIDATSQAASKFALANEYDKLMSAIGASGTNAYTSYDATVYVEEIPSNQLENWAKIQAERFADNVIRLFHTELETVYEEKNRSATSDGRKVYEAMFNGLFAKHPYGQQTVLGTQEHLKNPSITNIKNYYKKYYVPNNMAICMSGDFDPDRAIALIDKYFGGLPRGEDVQPLNIEEQPIEQPIVKTVYGNDAANLALAWRFGSAASADALKLKLMEMIITNGRAGLIDLNVKQKQRLLSAGSYVIDNVDYQALYLYGSPKEKQSLDEVRDILLGEIEKLKKGEFEEWLIAAVVNDFKRSQLYELQSNQARVGAFVDAFVNRTDWADKVKELDDMAKITKEDIVKFANEKLGANYVAVYKQTGKDPNEKTIDKPAITPLKINRDSTSAFVLAIQNAKVKPIEPVFVDYKKEIDFLAAKSGIPVWYKKNVENALFEMEYVFEMGSVNDKELALAVQYLQYLGTDKYTPEQIKQEFYKLGCNYSASTGEDRLYVSLNGLSENFEPALKLFEHLVSNAVVNEEAYKNLVGDILKSRSNAKLNHGRNFNVAVTYATYGANNPTTYILSAAQLSELKPQTLVEKVKRIADYEHKVLYYGPAAGKDLLPLLNAEHRAAEKLLPVPPAEKFEQQPTNGRKVFYAHYPAPQVNMAMLSKLGEYDKNKEAIITMYNEYFGGGMNAIVFQEIREARGLAYAAGARYNVTGRLDRSNYMTASIGTQTDKLKDAEQAFREILGDMPQSEKAFALAKESIISALRTQRITKSSVLWNYLNKQRLGLDYDIRRDVFEQVQKFTLADVVKFQQENIKGLPYNYVILGDKDKVDFKLLESYGEVQKLTQEEMFGY